MNARAFAVILISIGCAGSEVRHSKSSAVPKGAIAVVGDDAIDEGTVRRISEAQGAVPSVACNRAVFDALLAEFAKEHFHPSLTKQAAHGAAARVLLEELSRQAAATRLASACARASSSGLLTKATACVVRTSSGLSSSQKRRSVADATSESVGGPCAAA